MNRSESTVTRRFPKWFLVLALPALVVGTVLLVTLSDAPTPARPSLEKLLRDAQTVGGLSWQVRRIVYEKLPEKAREMIGLNDPGDQYRRQFNALYQLAESADDANRKIPVLTKIIQETTNEVTLAYACAALENLGTNAAPTLPMLLDLANRKPGYEEELLLHAAIQIGPNQPNVRARTTNRITQLIAMNSLSHVPKQLHNAPKKGLSTLMTFTGFLPGLEIDDSEITTLFDTSYASKNPKAISAMFIATLFNDESGSDFRADQIESAVRSWDRNCEPLLKSLTGGAVIRSTLNHEKALPMANHIYRDLLASEFVSAEEIALVYDLFAHSEQAGALREATRDTVPWLVRSPQDYRSDNGVWIEKLTGDNRPPDFRLKPWLFERVLADANPFQIEDWCRYLQYFGDIERTLPAAVAILESGTDSKQESLVTRLARRNPGDEDEAGSAYLERYGMKTNGPSGDVFRILVEPLPCERKKELLNNLTTAVWKLPPSIEKRNEALNRLARLTKQFTEENSQIE